VNFRITEGNETGALAINNDGVITVADADELPEQGVFNLRVQATDTSEEQLSSTAEVTISIGEIGKIGEMTDIDGDGEMTGPIDGILIARQLFGFFDISPNALVDGIPFHNNSQVSDPETINNTISQLKENLVIDIDGDGEVTGPIDGILIARQLFGFFDISPNALVDGIPFHDNSQVTNPETINNAINDLIESSIG
jgi:hypothetical protein